jgi:hypothetical protein
MTPGLVTVQVQGFPLDVFARAQEHSEELMREFALLAMRPAVTNGQAPQRLLALVDELAGRYTGLAEAPNAVRDEALAAGLATVDLVYTVPASIREDLVRLCELLDEADEFCRAEQLLTLASSPEEVAFRHWFLGEFVRQIDGGGPHPWQAYEPADGR